MKTTAILAGLLTSLLLPLAAGEQNVPLTGMPGGIPSEWRQNVSPYFKPLGKIELVKDGGVNAVKLTSGAKHTEMSLNTNYPTSAGDVIEIEADAKGSGTAMIGIYVNNKGWVLTKRHTFSTAADFTHVKAVLKEEDGKRPADTFQVFLGAGPKSEVVFKNIKMKTP